MKKIPGVFQYDPATLTRGPRPKGSGARYSEIVTPGCRWVLDGEGIATEKVDGTACLVAAGALWKRYDAKHGKKPPAAFMPAQDAPDPATGHWPGWVPVGDEPESKWHALAFNEIALVEGTYELVGPHFQANPYGLSKDRFVMHGESLATVPGEMATTFDLAGHRTFASIRDSLADMPHIEGVVFHHVDGRMAKVTRAGFGFEWPARGREAA